MLSNMRPSGHPAPSAAIGVGTFTWPMLRSGRKPTCACSVQWAGIGREMKGAKRMSERLFFPHRARPATSTVVVTEWRPLSEILTHPIEPIDMLDALYGRHPRCKTCGARLLRWGWYEAPDEPIHYWYCLECDKASREPCIQVRLKVEQIEEEGVSNVDD